MSTPQYTYTPGCELRTIDLTHGDIDYVWVDYEDARKQPLDTIPVSIALGTYDAPGDWHPADLVETNGADYKIRAGLLIGSTLTYPLGVYRAWVQVGDSSPTLIVKRADNRLVQIT